MQCYDKKLEATRGNINVGVKEVDTVLTTEELLQIIKQNNGLQYFQDFKNAKRENNRVQSLENLMLGDEIMANTFDFPETTNPSSNGYVELLMTEYIK